MKRDGFRTNLLGYFGDFHRALATPSGDLSVKGFIDVTKNIYALSVDTKALSKLMEIMLAPALQKFAKQNRLQMVLSAEQNHYPDFSFIAKSGRKIALDIKSCRRKSANTASGFTLGAFTGYFRNRDSKKNVVFPYGEYDKHYILGVIYTKQTAAPSAPAVYGMDDLQNILSAVKNFDFILQEKHKIANDKPGSGNTKNIGSCAKILDLREGRGPFAKLGAAVFDDYWTNYMTAEMARSAKLKKPPYSNLGEYLKHKSIKNA